MNRLASRGYCLFLWVLGALPALAFAEGLQVGGTEGLQVHGDVGFGPIFSNENSQNPAKFDEYRDLSNGVLSAVDLRVRNKENYLDIYLENLGRTDQYFNVQGGHYNLFKYQVYGDWLQHQLSEQPYGARTPFAGTGGAGLAANFPSLDPGTWHVFDFETKRQNIGGMFELSNIYVSPWYFRVDANEVKQTGVKPNSGANGDSPGNGFTDFAQPVNYTTDTASVEGGYSTRKAQASVNFMWSRFDNANTVLNWTNPFFGGNNVDTTSLPPTNDTWKVSLNGALRQLPVSSTLAGRFTYQELTDTVNMLGSVLDTGPAFVATNPSNSTFNGNLKNTTASVSLTSSPLARLDTRLYYNFYRRANDSNNVTFTSAALGCAPPGCTPNQFDYKKNDIGFEANYRFNPQNRVAAGYEYAWIYRHRVDSDHSDEWRAFAEWRNNSLDYLGVRLKYQYFQRRSDFLEGDAGVDANDPNFINRFVFRFDVADLNQNSVKLAFDSSPVQFLDLGLEANLRWDDYTNTVLGRTEDRREGYYASASYGDPQSLRTTLFGDAEWIHYDSTSRNINGGSCSTPNCFDPNTPPTSSAFNWDSQTHYMNWSLGLGTDWKPLERLSMKGSVLWARTQGWADVNAQNDFGNPFPVRSIDSTSSLTFNAKSTYQYDKHWSLTAGYAYELYHFTDDAYNGYRYVLQAGTAPGFFGTSYLSGAYAYPNYTAHIGYMFANYKF